MTKNSLHYLSSSCPTCNRRGLLLDDTRRDVEVIYDEENLDEIEELRSLIIFVVRRTCLTPRVLEEPSQRNKIFHSRCTINGRVCNLIIDPGSCKSIIAKAVVTKLNLPIQPHPTPYKLGSIQQGNDVSISRHSLEYSIGNAYKDQLLCDIAPMDGCHLLLGHPWEFDHRVTHDGYLNRYIFRFNNRTFTLKPSLPALPAPPSSLIKLMQRAQFITKMCKSGMVVFVLTAAVSPPQDNVLSIRLEPL